MARTNKLDYLAFYRYLRPAAEMITQAWEEEGERAAFGEWGELAEACSPLLDNNTTIFDCRALPIEFVKDTGAAALAELLATKENIALPYGTCYFEFAGESAVIAITVNSDGVDTIEVWGAENWTRDGVAVADVAGTFDEAVACFSNGLIQPGWEDASEGSAFFTVINSSGPEGDSVGKTRAILLLGALTLLREKLVVDRYLPDPAPRLTARREKDGKRALTGPSHVLRVNVPAIRRVAKTTSLGKHESPCLHWRRGHWRVLHRGSEFESRVWIKRCLVGDPDKGYVHKDYRLVYELPAMGEQVAPDHIEIIGEEPPI